MKITIEWDDDDCMRAEIDIDGRGFKVAAAPFGWESGPVEPRPEDDDENRRDLADAFMERISEPVWEMMRDHAYARRARGKAVGAHEALADNEIRDSGWDDDYE